MSIIILAGVEGFEPPNAWTRTTCLTTWRHPNIYELLLTGIALAYTLMRPRGIVALPQGKLKICYFSDRCTPQAQSRLSVVR